MAVETVPVVRSTITNVECDVATGNPIYIGHAYLNQLDTAAVWQIRKLTYDVANNLTTIKFANGSLNADQKWSDRASLSYS